MTYKVTFTLFATMCWAAKKTNNIFKIDEGNKTFLAIVAIDLTSKTRYIIRLYQLGIA